MRARAVRSLRRGGCRHVERPPVKACALPADRPRRRRPRRKAPSRSAEAAKKKRPRPEPQRRRRRRRRPVDRRLCRPCRSPSASAIQNDLTWTGDYNGLIDGEFSERSVAAVKAFQKRRQVKETGMLAPAERARSPPPSKAKQEVGWRMVDDRVTGARSACRPSRCRTQRSAQQRHALGLRAGPGAGRDLPHPRPRHDARGRVRAAEEGAAEPQARGQPAARRLLHPVRHAGPEEVLRARRRSRTARCAASPSCTTRRSKASWTRSWSRCRARSRRSRGTGLAGLIGPAPRRKVEYGTGIVVTRGRPHPHRPAADRRLQRHPGQPGSATPSASPRTRRAGSRCCASTARATSTPAALVHDGARGADLTLVGIADPQAQGGGRAVSTTTAQARRRRPAARRRSSASPAPPRSTRKAASSAW